MKTTSVFLVDDNVDYRWAMNLFLRKNEILTIGSHSRSDFIQLTSFEILPDVAIITLDSDKDVTMQCIALLRKSYPVGKILINSIYDDDRTNKEIVENGADAWVYKLHKDPEQILKAIRPLIQQ